MVSRETSYGAEHFFNLKGVWLAPLFAGTEYPWEVLQAGRKEKWIQSVIKPNIEKIRRRGTMTDMTTLVWPDGKVEEAKSGVNPATVGAALVEVGAFLVGDEIELRPGVVVEAGSWVTGPTILGEGTAVRHGAYLRGGIIAESKCVFGHTSEVKSSIFLNESKAPHFAYVGDSILGNHVNLGAGTKVSNLKITNDEVVVQLPSGQISTGLRKFGAIIGDGCETGCNSVLNPGVLLAPRCMVYPAIAVRKNYYKPGSIIR